MGFDRRFTLSLAAWIAALLGASAALLLALLTPGLAAARIVAAMIAFGVAAGLWRHVARTNTIIARFVEALRFGDFTTRFDGGQGAGFEALGKALSDAMKRLQDERNVAAHEQRYLDALVDDMPVALLTVDSVDGVRLGNKAARRLFDRHDGVRPEDYLDYSATLAARLADDTRKPRHELMILQLATGPQRAIVRSATLERLGLSVRALTVEPVQGTLDTAEIAAQTDLVRVLTHEILNSLTPVTSLAATAAMLLDEDGDIADARIAVTTLANRAEGLRHFIESYRAVAQPPEVRVQRFTAAPFAQELGRLFAAEWPEPVLTVSVEHDVAIEADPDLLAQTLINLLRNAAQVLRPQSTEGRIALTIARAEDGRTRLDVADNGPGVPLALRRDIFLPFFTTRADGTGVGLNLVRQIVVAHGGTIDIADAPDGGALFRILL